jgi:hypothetical protein
MAIQDRMLRAARADVALYEEVEHDPKATPEAMAIVAICAFSLGLGSVPLTGLGNYLPALVGSILSALVAWAVFSGVVYFVGTRLFQATATWEEVLRPLGYAYTPLVIGVLAILPIVGRLVVLAAALWTLFLVFIAIRAALDLDGSKTILTMILSIIPFWIINSLLSAVVGGVF